MGTANKGDVLQAHVLRTSDAGAWDDLQGSPSQAQFFGGSTADWGDFELVDGSGEDVRMLGFTTGEQAEWWFQTTHAQALSTAIELHVHWFMENDDAGDEFAFQAEVWAAPINGSFSKIGTYTGDDYVLQAGDSHKHHIYEISDNIWDANTTLSSLFLVRITRVAPATGTDSAETVNILYVDCHVLKDELGSAQETSKT